jgi:glycerol-3-phosphate dehydrogenase subunit B
MEADVIVIGGGMAGAIAALKAAEQGAEVILIRKGHGSTAMSSGTIDIAGPEKFLPLDSWNDVPPVAERLNEIIRVNPIHPYSIIAGGRKGIDVLCKRLATVCDFIIKKIPQLQLQGSFERSMALPTTLGTVKFSSYAPSSLYRGDLSEMRDARVLLVGINGLMLFQPRICRQTLARYSSLHLPRSIESIEIIEAVIPQNLEALPSAPFEFARFFDNQRVAEQFAKELRKRIPPETTHVAFPPILGLENYKETYESFCSGINAQVFELISPNFSVPGYRLQRAIEISLREHKVRLLNADVLDAKREGRRVRNLILKDWKTSRTATAKNYVLASGKFSSGGIAANDFPHEPIFGLPLFCRDIRVDNRFIQDLLSWNVEGKQLFLSCGVHVDARLRPVDPSGEPAYENLFAAGSIIGEYDYVVDKCGFGVAALTGYIAGEHAASQKGADG